MRKMSAHILILKSKAAEMSSERFGSVKCNENIFVWKCPDQHSCALRTVLGGREKNKNEWLVRCIQLRHQSFLFYMALTDFLRSRNGKCATGNLSGFRPTPRFCAFSLVKPIDWTLSSLEMINKNSCFHQFPHDGFTMSPPSSRPC